MHPMNTETAAELTTATFSTSPFMADIAALPGVDPALVAFRTWATAREALLDDRPEGEQEAAAFRALVETKASGPAGIAALAAAVREVFGNDEPVLDALVEQIIASAQEQASER
ncbi:hypothetical protein [Thioclava pacifica]|uniref:Uncharacterized protein n=1 Tax=Thioclava pacifica DSM 10166 TaxID=1353537 RepID=A0A074JCS7_9RHOB|nr:hypothetical protein [Thioclava pacifica]KEO53413.1 hypothetical protein TP2_17945 [Thioclava pacifica DSM 10166]